MNAGNRLSLRFEGIYNESNNSLITVGDILGATWAITPYEEQTSTLISKSLSSGTITVPEDGVVVVTLLEADTIDLMGEFSHELRLLASGSAVYTASRGKMTIKYKIANNPV